MNSTQLLIRKSILNINPEYPDNKLISSYQDFLKYKTILPYFKFNVNVFDSLVDLTLKLWHEDQRANKPALLGLISSYISKNDSKVPISEITSRRIFRLFFETVVLNDSYYSEATKNKMKSFANKAIKDVILTDEEVLLLINNINRSDHILNRLLRHPGSNHCITSWAKRNFLIDEYRKRRAELIGWLLDENPDYVVDKQTIIDDFEHLFKEDKDLVKSYIIDNESFIELFEEKKKQVIRENPDVADFNELEILSLNGIKRPRLSLEQRFYRPNYVWSPEFSKQVPDINRERNDFYSRLDYFLNLTMLWGISYSHLPVKVKVDLYFKFYSSEQFYSVLKIGNKTRNTELLERLYDENKKSPIFKNSKLYVF